MVLFNCTKFGKLQWIKAVKMLHWMCMYKDITGTADKFTYYYGSIDHQFTQYALLSETFESAQIRS